MIKLILGGFPCTEFSIAQKNNRINKVDFTADEFIAWHDSTPEWWLHIDEFEKIVANNLAIEDYKFALGLQLFLNCIVAVDRAKLKGDTVYYLFENVASMQKQIKQVMEEILHKLFNGQMTEINSAKVSAQNRKRIYFTNYGEIEQPEDRGILLRDVLDSGVSWIDKVYAYTTRCQAAEVRDTIVKHRHTMVAEPVNMTIDGKAQAIRATCYKDTIRNLVGNDVDRRTCVAEPVKVGEVGSGGQGAKTGLYAIPSDGKQQPIYEVRDGFITIKDKRYAIKLCDGFYIIRKLSISECRRLQTIPDWYTMPCSATQNYKMLGNGWNVETILHIVNHIPGIQTEELEVISLYDGMSCGRIVLKELDCKVTSYSAFEIDRYAIQTTKANFPDVNELGDAFAVREENWSL